MNFTFRKNILQHNDGRSCKTSRRLELQDFVNNAFNPSLEDCLTVVKKKQVQKALKRLYGRHYPVKVSPNCQFSQQWQTKNFQFEENIYCQIIQLQKPFYLIYTIFILMLEIVLMWFISSYRMLQLVQYDETMQILTSGIIIILIDGGAKIYLQLFIQKLDIQPKRILKKLKSQIYLLAYFLLNIVFVKCGVSQNSKPVYYVLDLLALYLLYKRAQILWQHIKVIVCTTSYKYQLRLIDLLATLMILGHLFALLLYSSSFYDADSNWTSKINDNINDKIYLQRYFYSIYFAFTTMLTIGYGDLIPMNKVEVLAVLAVQILGVATFSFVINQIGYTMSTIRKQEQDLESNLSTLSKMAKFYNLEQDLTNLVKQHLINNRKSIQTVYPEDQNNVLMKLNEDLRETVSLQNSISVVKSCSFFLCHWTKYFQSQIARKLVKKILHPNEILTQFIGKQKIYIVKSGKLQLYTNRSSNYKQHFKKLLKTIVPNPNELVCDNVYGYTSMVSSRPVKLTAISKEFSCVFVIDKDNFMSCVNSNKLDQEYFSQMRDRADGLKCVQQWEAPSVLNIRQHYIPSQVFVIKRNSSRLRACKNRRSYQVRSMHRRNGRFLSEPKQPLSEAIFNLKYFAASQNEIIPQSATNNQKELTEIEEKRNEKQSTNESFLNQDFEGVKEYIRYFRNSNVSNVLKKLERGFPRTCLQAEKALLYLTKQKKIWFDYLGKQKRI